MKPCYGQTWGTISDGLSPFERRLQSNIETLSFKGYLSSVPTMQYFPLLTNIVPGLKQLFTVMLIWNEWRTEFQDLGRPEVIVSQMELGWGKLVCASFLWCSVAVLHETKSASKGYQNSEVPQNVIPDLDMGVPWVWSPAPQKQMRK
jgi:hypothetical protein